MASTKLRVKGLRELEAALSDLQKEFGGKAAPQAMRPAVKAAIDPLKSQVTQGTPVDSGGLKDSVAAKIGKPTKKMLRSDHYNQNTVIAGRVGWFWRGRSLWNQALAVEFGTDDMAAEHVLEGVFDRESGGMLKRFKDTLGPAIEKKARSLAKRRR
tara:strand:- start:868 stop:1335 length:468 start_codon:yes stop_codon:yes gene_type:complete